MVMGILNFIKAFKEFTTVFLMTAGGPPLISGITDRYVIGATTTMDTFLFDVFSNTDDYGISSAYSVLMAGIVILLMLIWYVTKNKNFSASKKHRSLVIITSALQIIFSWKAGILPAAAYLLGLKDKRIFRAAAGLHLGWIIYRIAAAGFLEGFNPGIFPAIFTIYFSFTRPEPHSGRRMDNVQISPAFLGGLNLSLKGIISAFLIISSAALVYLLLWMSFSGVSACYIDGIFPPHPGINSFRSVLIEERIMLYFRNTIIVAGMTGIFVPAVCFPAAVWLNNRGRGMTVAALTFIQILSITGGMHSLIPLYSSFERIGLVNSFIPLIIISIYHSIPFSMFTITSWLNQMPRAFRDIALIEGLNPGAYLFKIILPLSRPVLTTAVMAAVIGAWNSFMAPLLFLNDDALYTISVKLYSFVGSIASGTPAWNIFAAASVINCLIIAVAFSKFRKPAGETKISDFTE